MSQSVIDQIRDRLFSSCPATERMQKLMRDHIDQELQKARVRQEQLILHVNEDRLEEIKLRYHGYFLAKFDDGSKSSANCTCDSLALFRNGCQCGAFQREQKSSP